MDESRFWELIDQTRDGTANVAEHADVLRKALESLSPDDIASFGQILENKLEELNHFDIWEVAYIINTGCGDDDFTNFRAGVIARGKDTFNIALQNPSRLGDLDNAEDLITGEDFWATYMQAWSNKTRAPSNIGPEVTMAPASNQASGEPFSEDEGCLSSKHPQLFAKYWKVTP